MEAISFEQELFMRAMKILADPHASSKEKTDAGEFMREYGTYFKEFGGYFQQEFDVPFKMYEDGFFWDMLSGTFKEEEKDPNDCSEYFDLTDINYM